jgi:hypothetical protein
LDLRHDAVSLVGLKEKLRVGGAVYDQQFLGLWRFLEPATDAG